MKTATSSRIFVDTNILLDATNSARKNHDTARRVLQGDYKFVFSSQIVREYLVVVTRPVSVNGFGMSLEDAMYNIKQMRRDIRLLPEEKPVLPTFLKLMKEIPAVGKAMHDAWVVATARVHSVSRIVTANTRDFSRYKALVNVSEPHRLI